MPCAVRYFDLPAVLAPALSEDAPGASVRTTPMPAGAVGSPAARAAPRATTIAAAGEPQVMGPRPGGAAPAQGRLASLAESVAAALAHSSEVRSARWAVAQTGASVRIARGGYYPTVTGNAGTGRIDSYDAEMRLSQTAYDWGRTSEQVKGARASREEAQAVPWAARETAAFEAADAFIGLQRMDELAAAADRGYRSW